MRYKVSFSAKEFIVEIQAPPACPTCLSRRVTNLGPSWAWDFEAPGNYVICLVGVIPVGCVIRSVSGAAGLVGISGATD